MIQGKKYKLSLFFLNKKVNNLNMVFGPFQIDRQSAAVRIGLGDDTEEALSF